MRRGPTAGGPGHLEKLAPNLRLGNPLEVASWCQRHASAKAAHEGLASVFRRGRTPFYPQAQLLVDKRADAVG